MGGTRRMTEGRAYRPLAASWSAIVMRPAIACCAARRLSRVAHNAIKLTSGSWSAGVVPDVEIVYRVQ